MPVFLSVARAATQYPNYTDRRGVMPPYVMPYQPTMLDEDFADWPRGRLTPSGEPFATDGSSLQPRYEFEPTLKPFEAGGTRTAYTLVGVSRDQNGNVLGGCTILLFDQATNTLRGTYTSDSVGNFRVQSSLNTSHYVVAYLNSIPVVAGTTVNTLTPVFV